MPWGRVEISGGFLSLGESALGQHLNTQLETPISHQFNRVIMNPMSHIDATIEELDGSIFYGRLMSELSDRDLHTAPRSDGQLSGETGATSPP